MTSLPQLLLATRNRGKLRELADLLGDIAVDLVSLDDVGIVVDVEETGATFEENAILKAETYRDLSGMLTLADDSGLEVDALDGEPGRALSQVCRSRRFGLGPHPADSQQSGLFSNTGMRPVSSTGQAMDRALSLRHRGRRARSADAVVLRGMRGQNRA